MNVGLTPTYLWMQYNYVVSDTATRKGKRKMYGWNGNGKTAEQNEYLGFSIEIRYGARF